MNAQWTVDYIFGLFEKLVNAVNCAEQVLDIEMEYPSVTYAKFPDALYDAKYNLLEDPSADINGNLIHMIKGPVKELMSSTRLVEAVHVEHAEGEFEKPDALYLNDITRLTLSAADPMIIGIAYAAVHDFPGLEVMFTNKKYSGSLDDVKKTGSPSVLVNMEIEVPGFPPAISEVQLYVDSFLSLKKSQHKTYEIGRAEKFTDLLRPIYKPKWEQMRCI